MHEALADPVTPHALAVCAFGLRLALDRALGANGVYLGIMCVWTALGALLAEVVSPVNAYDAKRPRRRRSERHTTTTTTTTTQALTPEEVEALERAHRERTRARERSKRIERVQFISPAATTTTPPAPGELTPLPTTASLESSEFMVSTESTTPISSQAASPIDTVPPPVIPPSIQPGSRGSSDLSQETASPTASRSSSTLTPHSPSPPPRPVPAPPPVLNYRLESRARRPSLTTVPEESTVPSSGQTRTDPDISQTRTEDDESSDISPLPDNDLDVGALGRVRLARSGLLLVPPNPSNPPEEGAALPRSHTPSLRNLEVVDADEESDELQTPQTRYLVVRDALETPRVTDDQLPVLPPPDVPVVPSHAQFEPHVSVSYPLPTQSSAGGDGTEPAITEIDDSYEASEISTGGLFGPTIEKADRLREEAREKYDEARRLEYQARTAERERRFRQAFVLRREAEEADKRMHELDAKAERRYFQAHNHRTRGLEPDTIDLHRLRKDEAVKRVEEAFWEVLKRNGRQLKVIVGKGKHSKDGVPALKPSIIQHMEGNKIPCRVQQFNDGVLVLTAPAA